MAALGAGPEVVEAGGVYLQIVFLSGVPLTLTFVLGAAMRGAGDSRTPMLVAVGINVVNVVVAAVLIFGLLGFPALGVAGSAWGAAAGRTGGDGGPAGAAGAGPAATGNLRLAGRDGWRPDVPLIRRLARIGLPSMGEQLSRSLGMLVFGTIVISLGTAVFAAQRITFNILSLSFLPGFGFAMAATALTGQALGAAPAGAGPPGHLVLGPLGGPVDGHDGGALLRRRARCSCACSRTTRRSSRSARRPCGCWPSGSRRWRWRWCWPGACAGRGTPASRC